MEKNYAMQYRKVQKSSWNEPYSSSSSFTRQSCSKPMHCTTESERRVADFSVVARLISKLATEFRKEDATRRIIIIIIIITGRCRRRVRRARGTSARRRRRTGRTPAATRLASSTASCRPARRRRPEASAAAARPRARPVPPRWTSRPTLTSNSRPQTVSGRPKNESGSQLFCRGYGLGLGLETKR